MTDYESQLADKRIFITGHTGFTGAWASIWLQRLGADVFGYSLEPETNPNLYSEARVGDLVSGIVADIRDFEKLQETMAAFQPDLVLHLAAQPLVRRSYRIPRETFDINSQGTANVLEAARQTPSVVGVLCVTTDKVYKNLESGRNYNEFDELGGKDPYSASKVSAEVVISSFRDSFEGKGIPLIAVARGGNIIGGGDWSEDRLIPDFIRAHVSGHSMPVRNPNSTRPWQHVLALIEGYFSILAGLLGEDAKQFARPFNLGPVDKDSICVGDLLAILANQIDGVKIEVHQSDLAEAGKLGLDSRLATKTFGWNPRWQIDDVIRKTAEWYEAHLKGEKSAYQLCVEQIDSWKAS